MIKFLILISLFFNGKLVAAIDWEELSKLSLARATSLEADELEMKALQFEAEFAGRWSNPQLMGQFGSLRAGKEKVATAEVSLTQQIPLSDKYSLRREIVLGQLKGQKLRSHWQRVLVSHQAKLAVWRLFVMRELFEHGSERKRRIEVIRKYLQTRPRVTVKQRVELSIIQSLLSQLEKMQDQKKSDLEKASAEVVFWIGRSLAENELPSEIPHFSTLRTSLDARVETSVNYQEAKARVLTSALETELAKKERKPDLFIGGGYRVENVAPENHFSYGIVGVNIPIWDTGSNRLEAARAREMREQKLLTTLERNGALEIIRAQTQLTYDLGQLKRFTGSTIHNYERTMKEAETGFKQGLLDVNTFLEAETQSHEFIDQVFLAWMSYLETLSTIQLVQGQEFQWESQK
jgi:outer membrane protein TolC